MGTELLRAEFPVLTPLVIDVPNSFQPAGKLDNGIPAIKVPDLGNGTLDIPGSYAFGADQAGRPLFQKFGRTAATTFLSPLGTGQYNAMQARLDRRFSHGVQLGAHYTWSKAIGPVDNTDSSPAVKALSYFGRNRVPRSYDRTHNLQLSNIWELPFGKGRKWMNGGGALSYIAGGWQINNLL